MLKQALEINRNLLPAPDQKAMLKVSQFDRPLVVHTRLQPACPGYGLDYRQRPIESVNPGGRDRAEDDVLFTMESDRNDDCFRVLIILAQCFIQFPPQFIHSQTRSLDVP